MIALVFLGLLACASAAPRYHHHNHRHGPIHEDCDFDNLFREDVFDTGRFWNNLNREMASLDAMLSDLSKRFPSISSPTGERVGNEYIVTVPISGFEEKDIIVKAKKGLLSIQAVRGNGLVKSSFLNVVTLPEYVNEGGNWSYKDGVLKIVFLISGSTTVKADEGTPELFTAAPEHSREEMEKHSEETNQEIDEKEDNRGDLDTYKNLPVASNVSDNGIEATTYAVDLNDEVEFVPMHY